MALIKSKNTTGLLKDAVVLDLGDVAQQARRIREQAEAEATRIVEEAQQRARELTDNAEAKGQEQGYAAGHEQGLAEGREQGRAEALEEMRQRLGALEQRWGEVADQLEQQRTAMEREGADAVLRFGVRFAEKVVHRSLAVDRSLVVDQVAEALSYVLRPADVVVQVHPDDRPVVDEALPGLVQRLSHLGHVRLEENDQLTPGGCVATYGQGRIDATVEAQVERLARAVLPEGGGVAADAADGRTSAAGDAPDEAGPEPEGEPGASSGEAGEVDGPSGTTGDEPAGGDEDAPADDET